MTALGCYKLLFLMTILIQVLLLPLQAFAIPLNIGGFFSTGISDANTNNPILMANQIEEKTNYVADTLFGLQLDTEVSMDTRFSAQLIAKERDNSFDLEAEWLFVSHQLSNNTSLRAGRLRIPLFLMSETIWVGQSYDWVRPPLEVYSLTVGLTQYNGISYLYPHNVEDTYFEFFNDTYIEFELFTGQSKGSFELLGLSGKLDSKEMYGGQFNFRTDNLDIRISTFQLRFQLIVPPIVDRPASAQIYVLGAHYSTSSWGVMSEYGYIDGSSPGSNTDALYVSVYVSMNLWMPIMTYAVSNTESGILETKYKGESITLGARYDFSESLSYKVQIFNGELFDGVSLLVQAPPAGFDDTVTMYSMSLSLIF